MNNKQYFIKKDGIKTDVNFTELVNVAKEEGYEGYGEIFTTSGAAKHLRKLGYKVGNNKI